jgi:hypothetical protein
VSLLGKITIITLGNGVETCVNPVTNFEEKAAKETE